MIIQLNGKDNIKFLSKLVSISINEENLLYKV